MHMGLDFSQMSKQSCTFFAMTMDHCSCALSWNFSNVDDIRATMRLSRMIVTSMA